MISRAPKHPYYPLGLKLEGYHPMVLKMDYILAVFAGSMAAVAMGTWYLSGGWTWRGPMGLDDTACARH